MTVDTASVLLRSLGFGAMFQALGAGLFVLQFERDLQETSSRVRRLTFSSAVAALLLVCLHYVMEAGRLSGMWSGIFDLELQELVWDSSVRTAWAERSLGFILLVAASSKHGRAAMLLTVAGVVSVALSFAAVGHTSEPDGPRWLALLLMAHILVAGFWFGSLLPLLWITRYEDRQRTAAVVEAFSTRAVWLVPGLFVAGVILTWNLVDRWSTFLEPYGILLLVKVTGFSILMGLAALNRWRYGPALRRDAAFVQSFRRSVTAEFAIILVILVMTAVLTSFYSPEP